ncbi:MAG: hypothetical protein ACP5D7_01005 [Limnospira sp.]
MMGIVRLRTNAPAKDVTYETIGSNMMPYEITPETTQDKQGLLRYFRGRGEEKLSELRQEIGNQNYKKLANVINRAVGESLDAFKAVIIDKSEANGWSDDDRLRAILASTYCAPQYRTKKLKVFAQGESSRKF